jgi:GNAT superfamily N-acetyltransferase
MTYTIALEGPEAIEDLRPLWLALRDHHASVAPGLGPVRSDDDTWARRRAEYARWLADGRSFVLVARDDDDGRAAGYAMCRVFDYASPTWDFERTLVDVETLSVLPDARGAGLGARLIAAVRAEAGRHGYDQVELTAVAANADALRFYEREGFRPAFVILRDSPRRP